MHRGIVGFFFFNEQAVTSLMFVTFYSEVKLPDALTFPMHELSLCEQRSEAKNR